MQDYDVIILGAGAAGLMCAIECGRRGRRTLVLDHADRAGKKILISGGGRSNFTNLGCTPENFLSQNPHFARSALARFTPADMVALVEKHNIPYHEKTLGQLFCDRTSRDLVTLLERECAEAKVRIQLETGIESVVPVGTGFELTTSAGVLRCHSVVVATGGLSIPKMGATGLGYEIARQSGLSIVEPRPGLVPLTFQPDQSQNWADLSGVSVEVLTQIVPRGTGFPQGVTKFREKLLITHRGLSGPAVLQISSYWRGGQPVVVDLAPGREVFGGLRTVGARRDLSAAFSAVKAVLPGRWAERWMAIHQPEVVKDLSNGSIAELERAMHAWTLVPAGTEGYAKAEVTVGGVDTKELDSRTMESKRVPGLYFIGEVVDVTGWLGGYNFQWAWASGFCAGQVA